jgi:DNA-binding response OmpR family regulator
VKGKVLLVHWREAEAEVLAKEIRHMGWTVDTETNDGERVSRRLKDDPADVVVIYLTRLPSHGRETGSSLKKRKSTKAIPLVYVDGNEEAVQRTRTQLPDAIYTTTERLDHTLSHLNDAEW